MTEEQEQKRTTGQVIDDLIAAGRQDLARALLDDKPGESEEPKPHLTGQDRLRAAQRKDALPGEAA